MKQIKNTFKFLQILNMISVAILMLSCDAYDLGDEEPLEYSIDQTNPTWAGGVGQLLAAKCASCHVPSAQRSKFVPSNTPATYDTISSESFFDATNASKIQSAYDRIFTNTTAPMPPNFATPLTTSEKAALKVFFESKLASVTSICGTSGTSSLTFTTTAAYFTNSCGSCHNAAATARSQYATIADVKKNRVTALLRLKETDVSKVMPQGNSTYKVTTEGLALINWLCFGSDLN